MSFGGQSNPPWQRNSLNAMQNNMQGMQNQLNVPPPNSAMPFQQQQQQNSQMYQQTMNQGQQQPNQGFGHSQMGQLQQTVGPMFTQAVSYPQTRGMPFPNAGANTMGGGGGGGNQSNSCNMQHQQGGQSNYINSVGTVSKWNNDCGMINDEVFFHKNVCKGVFPKVGDKVLFEANFSQNSQFKFTASRVQLVPNQSGNMQANQPPPLMSQNLKGSGYNAVPPPNEYQQRNMNHQRRAVSPSLSRRSVERRSGRDKKDTKVKDRDEDGDRKRRREENDRSRDKERRDRDRRDPSVEKRDRDRSPGRWSSPKRRRTRAIPRYAVQIPKTLLIAPNADVLDLRRRYTNLYVPSDFFYTHIKWPESFTPSNQFSIHRSCTFNIMQKTVEPPQENTTVYEPEDANYLFSAKVMLMGCPPMSEIYQKCLQDGKEQDEEVDVVHPSRLINFLVGTRGPNDPMAIGGPWSPSLDGNNPEKDPSVLIKTAIRTCKALTGIDLSNCTQWYRFVELYYHRAEHTNKGKLIPARIETVVIYLPDINSCLPTTTEWQALQTIYNETYERVIIQDAADVASAAAAVSASTSSSLANTSEPDVAESSAVPNSVQEEENKENPEEAVNEKEKREPSHYSVLDPKTMKVQDLRDELIARNLSIKGLKPQLIARLMKALNSEKSNGNNVASDTEDAKTVPDEECPNDEDMDGTVEVDMTDIVILDEVYDSKTQDSSSSKKEQAGMSQKEKQQLEKKYQLPESPQIVVHPSKDAKSGKFDCTVMSLSVLLDYRPEDTKERAFEVSLFAELFNEMIMRDFGLNIYKELSIQKEKLVDSAETKATGIKDESEKSKVDAEATDRDSEKGEKKSSRERKHSRRGDDETEDDNYSIKSGDKRKKSEKKVIVNPELLLSFVYFDTTHCGYIFDKDIEKLFHVIGLKLSRGQMRTILAKCISRDLLYYRKLTDKEKDENEVEEEKISEEVANIDDGNRVQFPVFVENNNAVSSTVENIEPVQSSGMVVYNGGVVDVGKTLEQLKRTEKARADIEKSLTDLKRNHNELQSNATKANNKIKDLQSEIKSLNRKLSDADQDVFTLTRKYNDHHSVLASIHDKVAPIFARHKSESSRDKDKDRDNKDRESRDNHKDKERDTKDQKTEEADEKKSVKSEE